MGFWGVCLGFLGVFLFVWFGFGGVVFFPELGLGKRCMYLLRFRLVIHFKIFVGLC